MKYPESLKYPYFGKQGTCVLKHLGTFVLFHLSPLVFSLFPYFTKLYFAKLLNSGASA